MIGREEHLSPAAAAEATDHLEAVSETRSLPEFHHDKRKMTKSGPAFPV